MNDFSFSSAEDLKIFFDKEKFKKIFILCGEKSFLSSGASKIINNLNLLNKKFFYKKFAHPVFEELILIINEIKNYSPDLILAIGGGSVLDYAKISNSLLNHKNLKQEIINSSYKIKKNAAKLLAIPTTAGSGAEVTSNAVIYIDNKKFSVEHEKIKPDFFYLLPELVIGASNKIKSSAGFDAIAQALESLISKKSNEISVEFAKKSLKISLKNYLAFLKKPNFENTAAMCLAANLSGKAINISKTTAPHAVSYPFTSIYNISHGHAVSLTLNKFLKFNYENLNNSTSDFDLKKRFEIMFNISNTSNILSFDKYLSHLKSQANLENNFINLGIDMKKDYPNIISGVNIQRLSNNPVQLTIKDLKKIIQK